MNHPLQDALPADGPSLELSAEDRLYEPLIGSWSVRAVDYLDDGSKREDAGEWHFGYVLEGRAVQDVWILPSRSRRTPDTPKEYNRYGTSIRSFHPKKKRWELTWSAGPAICSSPVERVVTSFRRDVATTGVSSAGSSRTSQNHPHAGTARALRMAGHPGNSGQSSS
jgi:hypothetical protein